MLEVFSGGFAKFLKYAIPRKEIQAWEKEGAGSQRASLRMLLLHRGSGTGAVSSLYAGGAGADLDAVLGRSGSRDRRRVQAH
jgi:hypothetical protein